MTQIHFTLDKTELQAFVLPERIFTTLTKFNVLMERQRDEYCNPPPHQRDSQMG